MTSGPRSEPETPANHHRRTQTNTSKSDMGERLHRSDIITSL